MVEGDVNGIGRVLVSYDLEGFDADPQDVSRELALDASKSSRRGQAITNNKGEVIGHKQTNRWTLSSAAVSSKNVNEHFRWLFARLLPLSDKLKAYTETVPALFSVLYESSYLYGGYGPVLDPDICPAIAQLEASLGFDIYCTSLHVD